MKETLFPDTMFTMKWPDIARHAAEGALVLIPAGVVEEHGPHLGLATDVLTAHLQCLAVRNLLAEGGRSAILAPPFYWGVCQSTGGFPGSFTIRQETATALLYDLIASLGHFGFKECVVINGHGDIAQHLALTDACRNATDALPIRARYAFPADRLHHYGLTGDEPFLCPVRPSDRCFGDTRTPDVHGGDQETALMHTFHPDCVDPVVAAKLEPVVLPESRIMEWLFGGHTAELSPNGYVGAPALHAQVDAHALLADTARRIRDAIIA